MVDIVVVVTMVPGFGHTIEFVRFASVDVSVRPSVLAIEMLTTLFHTL